MCGIAAIFLKTHPAGINHKTILKNQLKTMVQSMKHRGPDGEGMFIGDTVGLAMTRLAIVGGAAGKQPIWNEDRTIAVVCNGEIYNYRELRMKLEREGHVFCSRSDVEVIVHLYESYGEECLQHLEGIFGFTLWDAINEKLFVARDRLGVKPLYYAETCDRIYFASEMRALLIHTDVDKDIDKYGFSAYHSFRFVPAGRTIVRGIQKLSPAEYMVMHGEKQLLSKYWTAASAGHASNLRLPQKQKVSMLKQRLFEAVKHQGAHETKSGILLSGGLDSSALLAIHHQLFDEVPETFTVSFARPEEQTTRTEYTEVEHAAAVANTFGSKHICECYSARDVLRSLPSIIRALDEPVADPTAIPLWFVSRLAHQSGVKVLFSGEGLDELFNGYSVYRQTHWLSALKLFHPSTRRLGFMMLSKLGLPGRGVLSRSLLPPAEWYQGVGGVFSAHELSSLIVERGLQSVSAHEVQNSVRQIMNPVRHASVLQQMTYFDVFAWLPENTLVKSDKISMAHSIELRVPFLDYGVVDFALEMDDRDKLRGKVGKWIVRKALQGIVPDTIIQRKKAGFPIPLSAWMFNEWRDFVLSTLLDPNAYTRGIYNRTQIERLIHVPEQARKRSARLLWTVLCCELWHQYVYAASVDNFTQPSEKSVLNIVSTI